jgi:hypothetical protein
VTELQTPKVDLDPGDIIIISRLLDLEDNTVVVVADIKPPEEPPPTAAAAAASHDEALNSLPPPPNPALCFSPTTLGLA